MTKGIFLQSTLLHVNFAGKEELQEAVMPLTVTVFYYAIGFDNRSKIRKLPSWKPYALGESYSSAAAP